MMPTIGVKFPHVRILTIRGECDNVQSPKSTMLLSKGNTQKKSEEVLSKTGKLRAFTKCEICGKTLRQQNMDYHIKFHARFIEKSKTKTFQCPK